MAANSELLINLMLALGAGLVGAIIASRLGQSVILGYILAGLAIGPVTPGLVGDVAAVEALADVGIIFLMFAVGVQFSFGDLARVGRVAVVGGTVQVLGLIGLGYLLGVALGLRPLEALFLGAVVSNSSSTVLAKALDERGEMDSEHGRIGLGWSSVQDLGTVVLVVIFSALAQETERLWQDLAWSIGQAGVFLLLMVPVGSRVLPWFFSRVAALRNREVFILTVAAVALGTAYVSSLFGLSLALGAFVAGVVVSESDLSHQILGEITPLRDIFAGLFFVSVGMLIDPLAVVADPLLLFSVLLLIVVAKSLVSAAITALAGYPIRTALLTGVGLGQSAEFSVLLARLGVALGVVSGGVFSLMMAAAALSIVLAPNLLRVAAPLAAWLDERLPLKREAVPTELERAAEAGLRGHAVICGYGRVGRVIASALRRQNFPFVVIDEDPRVVRRLREQGQLTLLGNAANYVLLDRVNLPRARVLVVAIPDPLAARQIVDYARQLNPRLDIVVRTHSTTERGFLRERGVREAVVGELELAMELTRHTLRRFGLSSLETMAIVQGMRQRLEMDREEEPPEP